MCVCESRDNRCRGCGADALGDFLPANEGGLDGDVGDGSVTWGLGVDVWLTIVVGTLQVENGSREQRACTFRFDHFGMWGTVMLDRQLMY